MLGAMLFLTGLIVGHRRDAAPVREDIFEIGNEGMSVTELSQRLALPTGEIVKTLFMQGIMVQVNQVSCLTWPLSQQSHW